MDQNENEEPMLPSLADIKAVLAFLPIFEKPGFKFAEECGGEKQADGSFTMPWVALSDDASRFIKRLYEHRFILSSFKWTEWQHEAERYVNDPTAIKSADLETICKLLTTHVRKDRFCEGHLAGMFECGHIVYMLRRLNHFDGGTLMEVLWNGNWISAQRIRRGPRNSRVRFSLEGIERVELVPNDTLRDANTPLNIGTDNLAKRIVPITPMRSLYRYLRNLKGGASVVFAGLEERISPTPDLDAVAFLAALFKRSVDQFTTYSNVNERFVAEGSNRTENPQRSGFARCLLDQWRKDKSANGGLRFVDYEVSPYRTTRSCFEDGQRADRSGQGGIESDIYKQMSIECYQQIHSIVIQDSRLAYFWLSLR